jgi:hypothetical protein
VAGPPALGAARHRAGGEPFGGARDRAHARRIAVGAHVGFGGDGPVVRAQTLELGRELPWFTETANGRRRLATHGQHDPVAGEADAFGERRELGHRRARGRCEVRLGRVILRDHFEAEFVVEQQHELLAERHDAELRVRSEAALARDGRRQPRRRHRRTRLASGRLERRAEAFDFARERAEAVGVEVRRDDGVDAECTRERRHEHRLLAVHRCDHDAATLQRMRALFVRRCHTRASRRRP